ncbi:MAG TPA: RDD family protein, partial [Candidatus Wallbacteria bacterium]|nr:RDD family protein [Candidatus Wallbacteria bacterium]
MSFKCDKCGAEFEKEFAMKMHNKVCGTKPAERPKPQTAGNASAFKPAAANSVPASLPANVPAGISAGQMAGASSFTVPGPNKRICAYLIDSTIIVTFTNIINLGAIINFILQTAFILCRDANNAQGPGKKFVGLIVETDAGSSAEPQKCILRNVTLALPSLLLLLAPFIGGSIAALLCVAPVIVEYIMTRKNSEGRRIGDMIAGTRVNDIAPEKSDSQFFWYGLLAIILCVVLSTYLGSGMKQHDFVGNSGNGGSYQAAAMKWESYNSTAGGYSIMMPGKPEEKKEEIPAGNVKIMTNAAI